MRDETERQPVVPAEGSDEREWSDWWQSAWSGPQDEPQPERPQPPPPLA
ncbi:MAG: hypothetical protein U0232_21725 [Thermomicrobiales bacterium]